MVELDISWNELSHHSMVQICETLFENKTLRYLNLSWNNLTIFKASEYEIKPSVGNDEESLDVDTNLTQPGAAEFRAKQMDEINNLPPSESRDEFADRLLTETKKTQLKDHNIKVAHFLGHFIKHNKNLLHVDLTSTQMT